LIFTSHEVAAFAAMAFAAMAAALPARKTACHGPNLSDFRGSRRPAGGSLGKLLEANDTP